MDAATYSVSGVQSQMTSLVTSLEGTISNLRREIAATSRLTSSVHTPTSPRSRQLGRGQSECNLCGDDSTSHSARRGIEVRSDRSEAVRNDREGTSPKIKASYGQGGSENSGSRSFSLDHWKRKREMQKWAVSERMKKGEEHRKAIREAIKDTEQEIELLRSIGLKGNASKSKDRSIQPPQREAGNQHQLEGYISLSNEDLQQITNALEQNRSDIQQLTTVMTELKQSAVHKPEPTANQELEDLRRRVSGIEEMSSAIACLRQELLELKSSNSEALSDVRSRVEELCENAVRPSEIEMANNAIHAVETSAVSAADLHAITKEFDDFREALKKTEELSAKLDAQQQEISELKTSNSGLLESAVSDLSMRMDSLSMESADRSDIEAMNFAIDEIKGSTVPASKIHELESRINQTFEDFREAFMRTDDVASTVEVHNQQIRELKASNSTEDNAMHDLTVRLDALVENAAHKTDFETVTSALHDIQKSAVSAADLNALEARMIGEFDEIRKDSTRIDELAERIETINEEVLVLKESNMGMRESVLNDLTSRVHELSLGGGKQVDIAVLENALDEVRSSSVSAAEVRDLEERINAQLEDFRESLGGAEQVSSTVDDHSRQLLELKTTNIEKLENSLDELAFRVDELSRDTAERNEIETLARSVNQIKSSAISAADLNALEDRMVEEFDGFGKALDRIDDLTADIETCKQDTLELKNSKAGLTESALNDLALRVDELAKERSETNDRSVNDAVSAADLNAMEARMDEEFCDFRKALERTEQLSAAVDAHDQQLLELRTANEGFSERALDELALKVDELSKEGFDRSEVASLKAALDEQDTRLEKLIENVGEWKASFEAAVGENQHRETEIIRDFQEEIKELSVAVGEQATALSQQGEALSDLTERATRFKEMNVSVEQLKFNFDIWSSSMLEIEEKVDKLSKQTVGHEVIEQLKTEMNDELRDLKHSVQEALKEYFRGEREKTVIGSEEPPSSTEQDLSKFVHETQGRMQSMEQRISEIAEAQRIIPSHEVYIPASLPSAGEQVTDELELASTGGDINGESFEGDSSQGGLQYNPLFTPEPQRAYGAAVWPDRARGNGEEAVLDRALETVGYMVKLPGGAATSHTPEPCSESCSEISCEDQEGSMEDVMGRLAPIVGGSC